MLDLRAQEDHLARLAGMPFERFLDLLEGGTPGKLRAAYAASAGRYLALSGKGQRTREEMVELDCLDSSLQAAFGEKGLLALAARLLRILSGAGHGLMAFNARKPTGPLLANARLALGLVEGIGASGLSGTPIPVDGQKIALWARRARDAAGSLLQILSCWRWPGKIWRSSEAADACTGALADRLTALGAPEQCWLAVANLFDPQRTSAGQRVDRAVLCHRLAGISASAAIWQEAAQRFRQAAGLVGESLGN